MAKEHHDEIPDPIDPTRNRQSHEAQTVGQNHESLKASSKLVPVYDDQQDSMVQ